MISRHWSGLAHPQHADSYRHHLESETIPALRALPGFLGAAVHSRTVRHGVEFIVITHWTSLDAIRGFSGDDLELAVVPTAAQSLMQRYDARARHYEVVVSEMVKTG